MMLLDLVMFGWIMRLKLNWNASLVNFKVEKYIIE
jgi:hypothetical protein